MCLAPGRAAPGMVLAKPIADREGVPLLTAGTELDSAMLERLIRRGVGAVSVLIPDTRDERMIAEEIAAIEKRIAHIFRGSGSPARDELRSTILSFRIEAAE